MLKIVTPGAWSWDEPVAQLLKVSSRGLRGTDLSEFVKRAGHSMLPYLDQLRPGEEPLHLIALGATEFYGPNRNGDGFKAAACRAYCNTFEKLAHVYRNHANKDPRKSYGRVIKSAYHEPMHRVELLVGLNATKEAAERNRGLVADKELDKLNKGEAIPWSMACKVAYDVCSGCGKRAKNRSEYCTEETCPRGGLKYGITKVSSDGHILHADNPEPAFFDISHVWRPADRIAYSFGRFQKAASATDLPLSGAEMATACGLTAPLAVFAATGTRPELVQLLKYASQLSEVEQYEQQHGQRATDLAFVPAVQPAAPITVELDTPTKAAQAWRALADVGVVLPLHDWLTLATGDHAKAAAAHSDVASRLPGVYTRVCESPDCLDTLALAQQYQPLQAEPSAQFRNWATKLATTHSLTADAVTRRVRLAALRDVPAPRVRPLTDAHVKQAAASDGAEQLAQHYALYKLAFFAATVKNEDENARWATLLIRQNLLT